MRLLFCILMIMTLQACRNGSNTPDTSNIKLELKTVRFEKDLFSLDSSHFTTALDSLWAKYPEIEDIYMGRILNADPTKGEDSIANYVKSFTNSYRLLYDTSQIVFSDFSIYESEIKSALKLCKYYFPEYKVPTRIYTYIGPIDGYGDIMINGEAFLVGLQQHLGKHYSLYASGWVNETYPKYITNFFEPSTIAVKCVQNIMNDLFPLKKENLGFSELETENISLLKKMVQNGKRLYAISRLLPEKEEYLIMGYSPEQMKDCYAHEKIIWNLFVQNNLLQSIDINIIKNYIGESPKTQELGESAPGNIGSFAGWQIVKKYMGKHPEISLKQLMSTEDETIFEEAKYKP